VVTDTDHQAFTDIPLLGPSLGIEPVHGVLPAERGAEIARTYVAAFLDRHLKSQRQPILDKPSSRYPEAKLCPEACGQS
jgi:hypothetical protein